MIQHLEIGLALNETENGQSLNDTENEGGEEKEDEPEIDEIEIPDNEPVVKKSEIEEEKKLTVDHFYIDWRHLFLQANL